MADLVSRARELAYRAHAGQVDKAGRPYIEHVARVAVAVADDHRAQVVAFLHDVLEDAPDYEDEIADGFPRWVVNAVEAFSRDVWSPDYYYARIRANPLALRVKLADIADNADESRLALLDDKTAGRLRRKYANARKALGGGDA